MLKRGAPRLPDDIRKDEIVKLRFTAAEMDIIKRKAKRDERTVAGLLRSKVCRGLRVWGKR